MQGGGQGEEDQLAREPQIREQLRRKDCQTHAGPTSGDCRKAGDRRMQGTEAKGKKIRWPASRKFVSTCLSNALKDYDLDVALLRRELNMAGLRRYTPEETGCMQNVYCGEQ